MIRFYARFTTLAALAGLAGTMMAAPGMLMPAAAQNVNQTVHVEPGTVLTITRNGTMLMQRHVDPGLVRIVITYVSREGGGGRGRRRR